MNTYRQALDALRFTPEQKAAIAENLLSAAQAGQARTPRRKWGRVIAAAAVAAALCAACATGVLQNAVAILSAQFGSDPKQQEVIGDLTRPAAASATDNGVTVSVDAVMGDASSLVVLYRMERENGQPVLPQTEETKNVSDGNNTLGFEEDGFTQYFAQVEIPDHFTLYSNLEFLDFQVTDPVLYFYHQLTLSHDMTFPEPIEITLKNLYSHEFYSTGMSYNLKEAPVVDRNIPLVEGSWTLSISLEQDRTGVQLAQGQTFHAESIHGYPFTGTLQSAYLSPLSLSLVYDFTIDPSVREEIAQTYDPDSGLPLEAWIGQEMHLLEASFSPYLTHTDDSQTPVPLYFENADIFTDGSQCRVTVFFDEILPLDTIESLTIGDLTIPVS
ncbi:MAG TPA: DUF4179 domain-containing protein [Candidatus Evtepia faecavium]|nr:DUF4179 domain-containing protein [Candidatus Evtepia faecavium]